MSEAPPEVPAQPPRTRTRRRRIAAAATGLLVAVLLLEIALRLATVDAGHGRVRIAHIGLVPYLPPVTEPEPFPEPTGYLAYDPRCGWAPRPLGTSKDGLYAADQHGLRAPAAASRELPPGAARVMLCGDSFAHSDEVPWDASLAAAIERAVPGTVVLNAGVPGYGTDQAYLRWLALRDALRPDVVLVAVHQNDFERNVRLFSSGGEWGGSLPFSKPRFAPDGSGGFRLFNSPTVRGNAIARLFEGDYDETEFARRDFFHVDGVYDARATDVSRILRFVRSFAAHQEYRRRYLTREQTGSTGEIHAVTRHVVESFAKDVKAAGSRAIVLTLPARWQITSWRERNPWWDATLRAASASASCRYLDLTPLLSEDLARRGRDVLDPFTQKGMGHYTRETNDFAAGCLRDAIAEAISQARAGR